MNIFIVFGCTAIVSCISTAGIRLQIGMVAERKIVVGEDAYPPGMTRG